jgi:hypothetical protein
VIQSELFQAFTVSLLHFGVAHSIQHELHHTDHVGYFRIPHLWYVHEGGVLDVCNFDNGIELEQLFN